MPMSIDVVGQNDDKTKLLIRRIVAYVVLIALVILSLFPFYLLIINATRGKLQTGIEWVPSNELGNNIKMLFSGTTEVAYGNVFKALLNS